MAITIYEEPNKFNQVRQTIPFLVYSDLFNTGSFDAIERSFKYLFEIKVLNTQGQFKTFSTVAIPPRPDNLLGFFDASAIVKSAITYDLGTHTALTAQPCPKSIVEFMVICTERYLDTNGNYISGNPELIGQYYAIDAGVNESLSTYLMDYSVQAAPLHHHFLCGDDLKVYQNEPFSLSWLVEPKLSGNVLEYKHADYGSFDKVTTPTLPTVFTGFTTNSTFVLNSTLVTTPSVNGKSMLMAMKPLGFTSITSNATIAAFNNLFLEDNSTYTFDVWIKMPAPLGTFTTLRSFSVTATGLKVASIVSNNTVPIYIAGIMGTVPHGFHKLTVTFTTNTNVASTTLQIRATTSSVVGAPLTILNNASIFIDSARVYKKLTTNDVLSSGQIIVDDGLPTTQTWNIPSTYFTTNLLPVEDFSDGRFDMPVGPYSGILSSVTGAQDASTGFYKNSAGNRGTHFRVRLRDNTTATIGLSEKIYQDPTDCTRFTPIKIKWKNSLGGWDFFTFTKVSSAVTNVERENYKRSRGTITQAGSAYNYVESDNDRGYKSLNIKLEDTFSVASDWIGNETAKWLQDLYTSDEVYLLNPEVFQKFTNLSPFDVEYPVFVQQTDVEFQNNAPDRKLINVILDIVPAVRFEDNSTNIS